MQAKRWALWVGIIVVVFAAIALWKYESGRIKPFPINPSDHISSWSFKGAYTGNQALTDQANADIAHLTSLLGKGQYDDYDLHIGMGNDYDLLGNGQASYDEYDRAIAVHPDKGLAYVDLAHLLNQLGANYTAADAYAKATTVEPTVLEYHLERLTFLTTYFPNDNARLLAAFSDVSKVYGDVAQVLVIEAQWLEGQHRYADAIKALGRAKLISPGRDTSAIDAEIARDQAKL